MLKLPVINTKKKNYVQLTILLAMSSGGVSTKVEIAGSSFGFLIFRIATLWRQNGQLLIYLYTINQLIHLEK